VMSAASMHAPLITGTVLAGTIYFTTGLSDGYDLP
jgi:hypothetical protein